MKNLEAYLTFLVGISIVGFFLYYLGSQSPRSKRISGTILSIILVGFCLHHLVPPSEQIHLGIDLKGGSSFTVRLNPGKDDNGKDIPISPDARAHAITILQNRLDPLGQKELFLAPQGEDRILIQMPGATDEDAIEVRKTIEKVAKLDFHLVHPENASLLAEMDATKRIIPGWKVLNERLSDKEIQDGITPRRLIVRAKPDLAGTYVTRSAAAYTPKGWVVNIQFNSEGAKLFGDLTAANVNHRLAVVVDNEVISAPNLNEAIRGGSCEISGSFTEKEARDLATALENPLGNPLEVMDESRVSATYGQDTIKQGVLASLYGLIGTVVFLLFYYRVAGLVAVIALVVNGVIMLGIMALFESTLTMPGIAGFILSLGMAVDANVLIYERLREELNAGKSVVTALNAAYDKAFSAIFDSNITSLITAAILFFIGSGLIKGFAVTLCIGILASLFSALLVTRVLFLWSTDLNLLKKIKVLNLIPNKLYNFLKYTRPATIISILLTVGSIALVAVKGNSALGIDFRGGSLVEIGLKSGQTLSTEEINSSLKTIGLDESSYFYQEGSTGTGVQLVRIRGEYDDGVKIENALLSSYQDRIESSTTERIGSQLGHEMLKKSIWALVLGAVGIMIYVGFRFEFSFSVGVIISLIHDVVISLGLIVLAGQELSLLHVGALLTIAGYSINDTIVIFDRIRENILNEDGTPEEVMNRAISATLSRTLLTSVTVLFSLAMLHFVGGPALREFSYPIFVGIVIGTYSSIFVAAPVVLWWSRITGRNLREQVESSEREKEEIMLGAEGLSTVKSSQKATPITDLE